MIFIVTISRFALRHCRLTPSLLSLPKIGSVFPTAKSTLSTPKIDASRRQAGEPGRRKRARNPIVVYAVRRNPPRKQSAHPSIHPAIHRSEQTHPAAVGILKAMLGSRTSHFPGVAFVARSEQASYVAETYVSLLFLRIKIPREIRHVAKPVQDRITVLRHVNGKRTMTVFIHRVFRTMYRVIIVS